MGAPSLDPLGKTLATPPSNGVKRARALWRLFFEPKSIDEDVRRREYILNVILGWSMVMLAALDGSVLYHSITRGNDYHGVSFWAFSAVVVFFVGLYALSRRGYVRAASCCLVALYFAGASYAAYEWGANLETALLGYALVIVITSILLGTEFSFFVTAGTGLFLISLWHLQWHEYIVVPKKQVSSQTDAVVFTIIFLAITVVAWLSNREIGRSLFRARTSERTLKEERDLLEVRVEERTQALRDSELKKIEALYQFAEFGQLSSGLFHDLLNLINATSLQNERLAREVTEDALANARRVNKRMENFVSAMRRQLARQDTHENFAIGDIVEQAIQLLAYKAKENRIEILFHGTPGMEYAGSPFKFHQVAMNLILNAIESYADAAAVEANRRLVEVRARYDGDRVVLEVQDYGCGIAPDIQKKIFEPFFTTKSLNGMGIGLATVKKIVEQDFHGTIAIESQTGKGALFAIALPRGMRRDR